MSITAVGPRLGLIGPPPVAPERTLLSAPGVLQTEDFPRWMNGVNQRPYPNPITVDQWNPCEVEQVKDAVGTNDELTFDPVAIYLRDECSTIGDLADLKEGTRISLEAGTAQAIELVLAQGGGAGITPNTNPYLGDSGLSVLNGGHAVSPRQGMAWLEDHLANNYAARGMIHATPGTVDLLSTELWEDDSSLYTQAGTPVVPGRGYVAAPAGTLSPGDGQAFMFATSQVRVWMTEITVTDLISSLDRENNRVAFIAERFVLVTWNADEVHAGILVDWALATS